MIDRTQLTETRLFLLREVPDPDGSLADALADLIDNSALVSLDFPTDEQVEAGWAAFNDPTSIGFRRALEAVRQTMIGEDAQQ